MPQKDPRELANLFGMGGRSGGPPPIAPKPKAAPVVDAIEAPAVEEPTEMPPCAHASMCPFYKSEQEAAEPLEAAEPPEKGMGGGMRGGMGEM